MCLRTLVFVAAVACYVLNGATLHRAGADEQWFFVTVETHVHRADTAVSSEHPQERRWYISSVVALPDDEKMYSIKKKVISYFNDNVVDPAVKRGVVVDYYDQELEIDGGSVLSAKDRADSENMRNKEIEFRKGQSGNIYSFNLTFGPAHGEATAGPRLIYRDKEAANYEGGQTAAPAATTTNAGSTAPAATTTATSATLTTTPATPALPAAPQILKSTLLVRADRMVRYWKQPNAENYWSWVPAASFYVLGPVPAGSKFAMDFTMPDGKPWTTVEAAVPALEPTALSQVVIPGAGSHMDKRAIIDTGSFGFKIRLRNEAAGTNQTMLSGKFHVAKMHKGNTQPAFKNQFEFYVDQDWALPIGYVWVDWLAEPKVPPLHAALWFKGEDLDDQKLVANLFYNGKQIASSKDETGTAHSTVSLLTNGAEAGDPRWERWEFIWRNVRGWNTDDSANHWDNTHFLAKNAGDYEIKVLRDGKLVRSTRFKVGADGKIEDNGLVAGNQIGGIAMIVPVKVSGETDGKWNAAAWKTDAFYGNPLRGFTAP